MESGVSTDAGTEPSESHAAALGPGRRLLVVAPHPDDETLAAGGLLQQAQAAGAGIAIWLLTDGDNNPWPQRWLERRWRLDSAARVRWGARRRAESAAALRQLGLDPGGVLRAFGWPDGGLTDLFLANPATIIGEIAGYMRDFAPTDLVLPAAADRHPDHGAAALLFTLAAAQARLCPRIHAYCIHGGGQRHGPPAPRLADAEWRRKQLAVAEYASQAALTGPRLRRMAARQEAFEADAFGSAAVAPRWVPRLEAGPDGCRLVCDLPWPHPALARQRLLVVSAPGGVPVVRVLAGPALAAASQPRGGGTRLTVPGVNLAAREAFVKLEPLRRGLWIFDRYPWARLPAQPRATGGGPTPRQRPGP